MENSTDKKTETKKFGKILLTNNDILDLDELYEDLLRVADEKGFTRYKNKVKRALFLAKYDVKLYFGKLVDRVFPPIYY